MGIWDKLRGELVDIVEWLDPSSDTLVHRFERYNNEIKYGARLVVREGQAAVLVDQGQIADVFQPGLYTLETANIPILSTIKGWKHGFNSPFKAEVYFVSTRVFTDLKWGTLNPVMLRDAEFGPLRLRAFGTYAARVKDPGAFLKHIVGTEGTFTTDEIASQLRNLIVSRLADALGESKIPALDLAANYNELGDFLKGKIAPEFGEWGLELTKMLVENISLPPEVEAAMDKRTSMGVIGNLNAYSQFQAAEAMKAAAQNPGAAGGGMGMAMGIAMAGQMNQAMQGGGAGAPAGPPPIPGGLSIFLAIDGKQAGPFDAAALNEQAARGTLKAETLVWRAGMTQWAPASTLPELAGMLGSNPPPLPPR